MAGDIRDTACIYAWNYPVINFSRKELRYCCRSAPQKLSDEQIQQGPSIFTSSKSVVNTRRDLLQGIKNANCSACWEIEAAGGIGPRTRIDEFVDLVRKHSVWPKLNWDQTAARLQNLTAQDMDRLANLQAVRNIEISFGNTCDLKCMYCNHHYSSQWAGEMLAHGELKEHELAAELPRHSDAAYEDAWWTWFETESGLCAESVCFIGGEPLIMDKFYSYSQRIIDFWSADPAKKHRELSLVTNFNTPARFYQRFITVCQQIINAPNIHMDLNVSCESLGARTEFIRSGSDWQLMTQNIDQLFGWLRQHDPANKITFSLQIAMNALCISDLPRFFAWVIDLQRQHGRTISLRPNQVVYPDWLNPHILPSEYSCYIDQSLALLDAETQSTGFPSNFHRYGDWHSYMIFLADLRNAMVSSSKDSVARQRFAQRLQTLSQRRGLDFVNTFPEMVPFLELCRQQ